MKESIHLLFSSPSFCPLSKKATSLVHSWKFNYFPLQPEVKREPDGCQVTVTDLSGGNVPLPLLSFRALPVTSSGRKHPLLNSKFPYEKQPPLLETIVFQSLVKSTLRTHSCWTSSSSLWAVGSNGPMQLDLVNTGATEIPWGICIAPNVPSHLTYKMKGPEIQPCPFHF